jgi:hypothetical protein
VLSVDNPLDKDNVMPAESVSSTLHRRANAATCTQGDVLDIRLIYLYHKHINLRVRVT